MKYLVLLALLIGGPMWGLLTRVRDRNVAVATGTAAYGQGNAALAATAFAAALKAQAQRTPDPRLLLNLAHSQARAGQVAAAHATYGRLLAGSPGGLGSIARQQLAVLVAQEGELAQALSLLRQALLLNPQNAGARYNYEVLSAYLAKKPNRPVIGPPHAPKPTPAKPTPDKNAADQRQPANKAGTDRQGEINDSKPTPATPNTPPERRPNSTGQPDNQRPASANGPLAEGNRTPSAGPAQPLANGAAPGSQRGLDRRTETVGTAAPGANTRLGTDAATPNDQRLQTQRERLQAMNLSPAQAQQILETLRAQEQQYLQQLARPDGPKPDPNKPNW
jgi:hypothetical protein